MGHRLPSGDIGGDLRRDERGAILVLGIFMCSCIVGALWYLAGIGSAIVYRERMQEAADAIAFSGAVLHARGMNLIVLINFVMAAILAIRVEMRWRSRADDRRHGPFVSPSLAQAWRALFGGAYALANPDQPPAESHQSSDQGASNVQTLIRLAGHRGALGLRSSRVTL